MFNKKFRHKITGIFLFPVFYFLVTSLMTYPLITQFTTHLPGAGEDGPVHVWHLWWFKKAVLDLKQSPLTTDWIFYPQKINLVFDVHTFTNAIIALPLSYFFDWPIVSNILVFLGFILSGVGSFYLIRKIWHYDLGALLGSLVFTFSPVVLAQMTDGHFNLTTTWFLPFFLLFFLETTNFHRFQNRYSPSFDSDDDRQELLTGRNLWKILKDPVLAGLFLGIFALNDYTLSAFALSFSGLILMFRFFELLKKKFTETTNYFWYFFRIFLVYLVYAIIFSPLWIPALKNYFTGFKPGVSLMTQNVWSADLLAFIMPQIWHPFWNFLVRHLKVSAVESTVFLGWLVIVFVIFALYKWFENLWGIYSSKKQKNTRPPRHPPADGLADAEKTKKQLFSQNHKTAKSLVFTEALSDSTTYQLLITNYQLHFEKLTFWLFLAISFFILSLGPFLHYNTQWQWRVFGHDIVIPLPFTLYHKIPIIGGTQEPARMVIFLMLPLAVLCAYVLKILIEQWREIYQIIFLIFSIIILLFEYSFYPYPTFDLTVPKIYYQIAQNPAEVAVMIMPLGWNSGNRSLGKNVLGNLQYYQVVHNKKSFRGTVARLATENFDFYEKIDGMGFLIQPGGCPKNIEDLQPKRILKILGDFNVGYIVVHLGYKDKGVDVGCLEKVILGDYQKIYDNLNEQIVAYRRQSK